MAGCGTNEVSCHCHKESDTAVTRQLVCPRSCCIRCEGKPLPEDCSAFTALTEWSLNAKSTLRLWDRQQTALEGDLGISQTGNVCLLHVPVWVFLEAVATPQRFIYIYFFNFMSHFTSRTSENRDVSFNTNSIAMINAEHCRCEGTSVTENVSFTERLFTQKPLVQVWHMLLSDLDMVEHWLFQKCLFWRASSSLLLLRTRRGRDVPESHWLQALGEQRRGRTTTWHHPSPM